MNSQDPVIKKETPNKPLTLARKMVHNLETNMELSVMASTEQAARSQQRRAIGGRSSAGYIDR